MEVILVKSINDNKIINIVKKAIDEKFKNFRNFFWENKIRPLFKTQEKDFEGALFMKVFVNFCGLGCTVFWGLGCTVRGN